MNRRINDGMLYLISAPSGAGKTSLVEALLKAPSPSSDGGAKGTDRPCPAKLCVSVSHTTRAMRPGEADGEDYHFVSAEAFQRMRREGAFLENAEVFGHCYGTSKAWVEEKLAQGWDVILEIDWQGAAQVKALRPDSVSIFILPPSLESLRQRLVQRGQDEAKVIEARMVQAEDEITRCRQADYIVINDDFDSSLADLKAIIRGAKLKRGRQLDNHEELLQKLISQAAHKHGE